MKKETDTYFSVLLRFNASGCLEDVYVNAPDDRTVAVLEKALEKLVNPSHFGRVIRFLGGVHGL